MIRGMRLHADEHDLWQVRSVSRVHYKDLLFHSHHKMMYFENQNFKLQGVSYNNCEVWYYMYPSLCRSLTESTGAIYKMQKQTPWNWIGWIWYYFLSSLPLSKQKIYPSPNMFWQRRSIFGSYYASLFGLIRLNRHLVTPILKSIYKEKKNTIGFINIIPSRVYHRYPNLFIKSLFSLQSTPGNFAPLNPRSLAFRNPIHPWSLRTNETNPWSLGQYLFKPPLPLIGLESFIKFVHS